jgi:hypothetical protein
MNSQSQLQRNRMRRRRREREKRERRERERKKERKREKRKREGEGGSGTVCAVCDESGEAGEASRGGEEDGSLSRGVAVIQRDGMFCAHRDGVLHCRIALSSHKTQMTRKANEERENLRS